MDLFSELTSSVDAFSDRAQTFCPYLFWEPWDCVEPGPDVYMKAEEDGVALGDDDVARLAGPYPRLFQSGHVLSNKKISCIQAGSRVGKSHTNLITLGASISRQPPYSLRYEKGEDTGIRRQITPVNIFRFGRRDKVTGKVIDYNVNAPLDPASWNCGNIEGAGIFPEELYCPDGGQIWVGTLARSINTYWWPALAGAGKQRLIPDEFLDTKRGNKGSNWGDKAIFGPRDTTIFIKSYDSERKTFESQTCHILLFDEEPTKPELYVSGAGHCEYERWSFTPWGGVTWSQSLFFGCISQKAKDKGLEHGIGSHPREDFDYYHASQYDSPYVDSERRDRNRSSFPLHERKSVIWGRYSKHEGQPFFDRSKIQVWTDRFLHNYKVAKFTIDEAWQGTYRNSFSTCPGLMEAKFSRTDKEDGAPIEENLRDTWRIYENPMKDVGYLAVFDSAEGAIDPSQVQDKSFGMIVRAPLPSDPVEYDDVPVIVATTRSTLPTIAFANSSMPVLMYYNNAVLAAERGHGKDNEAFGLTMDIWPFWYHHTTRNDTTKRLHKRPGFDTNASTRTAMFDKIRTWLDSFTPEQDPNIKDSWLFDELGGAIVKTTAGGKHRCDHTRDGSLDGVICLGIATYILQQFPEVIVCNKREESEDKERKGLFARLRNQQNIEQSKSGAMGAGVAGLGGR